MGVGTRGDERTTAKRHGSTRPEEFAAAVACHRPTLTGLGDVYRQPTAAPLATLAATLVLLVAGWQTYTVAVTRGPVFATLVALTFAFAYWVASSYWAVQNTYVATALATRDLESEN